jgi:probable rRNA maturation factor
MPARFFEQEVNARLKHRRALSVFLDDLIKRRRPDIQKVQLSYIFCSDARLHGINLQFLKHDDFTDIITFDLQEGANELCGEIYISTDRVAENAKTFQNTYDRELHRVIFHGVLHLCGLGDKSPAEQQAMRAAEDEAIEAWYGTSR